MERQQYSVIPSPSRVVAALAQPLFYLLALGYGLGGVFQAAGQGSYIQFLVPGIVGMTIVFTSIFNGMQVIWERQFGFMKATLVAPVPRSAIMLGRTLGGPPSPPCRV
jgi:ABC-2 type transport system permease protein